MKRLVLLLAIVLLSVQTLYAGERWELKAKGVYERVEYIPGDFISPGKTVHHFENGNTWVIKRHRSVKLKKGVCYEVWWDSKHAELRIVACDSEKVFK